MKIVFVKTSGMIGFVDQPKWKDGDVRDVKKSRAEYLLSTHPANFMKADDYTDKVKKDAADIIKVDEAKKNARPHGHPVEAGDTTGADTTALTAEENLLFESAAKKIDNNEVLTEEEQAVFDKVEAKTSNDAGQEGSDNG